jgi:hypothetical protein
MEATLGISLHTHLYLNLQKFCLSYYLLCFLFNKIEAEGRTGSAGSEGEKAVVKGERWPKQCIHI